MGCDAIAILGGTAGGGRLGFFLLFISCACFDRARLLIFWRAAVIYESGFCERKISAGFFFGGLKSISVFLDVAQLCLGCASDKIDWIYRTLRRIRCNLKEAVKFEAVSLFCYISLR